MKTKQKLFDIWVKREDTFIATLKADSLNQALEIAANMDIDDLIDAPGETIDSKHEITGVLKS